MEIVVTGKIVDILAARTGVSQSNNQWMSQDFVIETEDNIKICFNVFGEKAIQNSGLKINAEVCVALEVESRPYSNGEKYFTSIKLKRAFIPAEKAMGGQMRDNAHSHASVVQSEVSAAQPQAADNVPPARPSVADKQPVGADDLPF